MTRTQKIILGAAVASLLIFFLLRKKSPFEKKGAPMKLQPLSTGAPNGGEYPREQTSTDDQGMYDLFGTTSKEGDHIRSFQSQYDVLSNDGKWGPDTRAVARLFYWGCEWTVQATPEERLHGFSRTFQRESGGSPSHIMWDGEFRCLWPTHKACIQGLHYGVTAGINQAVQHAGSLGRVIARVNRDAPHVLTSAMDGRANADDVLALTTAPTDGPWVDDPLGDGKVNNRTKRLPDGNFLWQEPWRSRVQNLWLQPETHRAQIEVMDERYLQPALETFKKYGFTRRAEFAVIADSMNHLGVSGTRTRMDRAFPSGYRDGSPDDIMKFIHEYRHSDPARTQKIRNRRLQVLKENHPGVCYA